MVRPPNITIYSELRISPESTDLRKMGWPRFQKAMLAI